MIYVYDILLLLFFLPAVILIAARYKNRIASEFLFKAAERFGFWGMGWRKGGGKPLIWVHCASLGEVKAVEPVLRKLQGYSLLITTVTLSGRSYAIASKLADYVYFVPLDLSFLVKKTFKSTGAKALILVETELWPGLIYAAGKCGAKVFLINARLSSHSYPVYRFFKIFWKPVLNRVDILCARSREDADRFRSLGYPSERITLTGNIKYDADTKTQVCSRMELGFKDDDIIWVCGSTRKGENEKLISSWMVLKGRFPKLKLVIAPRHLNRAKDITDILSSSNIRFNVRSKGIYSGFECVVLDTFGELRKYYSVCDIAFVGGSLVKKGGQNPIEPASYAKPVIFGANMDNFLSEASALLSSGGGFQAGSGLELENYVEKLACDKELRVRAGKKALDAVLLQKGAVDRTVDIINSVLAGSVGGGNK